MKYQPLLGLFALVAASLPQRADACSVDASVPSCTSGGVELESGAQIPANAAGIPFWAGDSSDFTLVDAAGQTVPTTVVD